MATEERECPVCGFLVGEEDGECFTCGADLTEEEEDYIVEEEYYPE